MSVLAALRGAATVVAVDVNRKAVRNTKANAALHSVDNVVDARVSDVFSSVRKSDRFRGQSRGGSGEIRFIRAPPQDVVREA
jgi:23S rRNA G2069 N7-methylase RlmK/C1962 C5-methylase RlmI